MKPTFLKTIFLLLGAAILATSCAKEEFHLNNTDNFSSEPTLVGAWAYQSGEEEYSINYPTPFDTVLVPEYPTVRDLLFQPNGIAVVEERSIAEIWPPLYVETSYTWSISANRTTIQMMGSLGEIYTWQILLLTNNQLKVKITRPDASSNGAEIISTNTYVRK